MLFVPFNVTPIERSDLQYAEKSIERGHTAGTGCYTQWSENLISNRLGAKRTLLTSSCTHALELAALLLQINKGDEVIVPSFTFVSTANAFALRGAKIIFADVDESTLNISVNEIRKLITRRTKAICVVHYAGVASELDEIMAVGKEFDITIIEDNAHGLFGKYKNRFLGTFGTFSTLSFHETKNISCGEGGALVVNDTKYEELAEICREKGTDRSRFLRGQVDKYTWVNIGSSWIMSEISAGILFSQLERSDEIYQKRLNIYLSYEQSLKSWAEHNNVRLPVVPAYCEHPAHLFHLRFSRAELRSRFIEYLSDRGVNAVFHYQPLNLSVMGKSFGGYVGQCPVAEDAGDTLVRLPLFSSMSSEQLDQILTSVLSFTC